MILFDGTRIFILQLRRFPNNEKLAKAHAYLRTNCKWGGNDTTTEVYGFEMDGFEMPEETMRENLVTVSAILGLLDR